ncbi:MAG: hypothetical protein V3W34_08335 [Phycisphaerae bacterium]
MIPALIVFDTTARAQNTALDNDIEELRKRGPSGANDDRIIDDWLTIQFDKLTGGDDAARAREQFMHELDRLRNAPESTERFTEALAKRLGAGIKTELEKAPPPPTARAETMVLALIEADDQRTAPGLTAALKFPAVSVRYLGAKGLQRIRDSLSTNPINEVRHVVRVLGDVGATEANAVVVERIYRAMSFANPDAEVFGAIAQVLQGRVQRYRDGAALDDTAESAILDYLSGRQTSAQQAAPIIRELAALLRLDVERYDRQNLQPRARDSIERRIDMCESAIERITGLTGGDVRGVMKQGGAGVAPAMKLELFKWTGTQREAGALNAAPWNVAREAP